MAKDLSRLSRAVSHALRHEPWLYELELDDEGWTDIAALLSALRQESESWADLQPSDLDDMIRTSSKQRHEMVQGRIRALYGHSLPGKLTKVRSRPPPVLFHGTAPSIVSAIRRDGLLPMGRQYVHLSIDRDVAQHVGQRKGPSPIVLSIDADAAWTAGVSFYVGNERVWLADHVPAEHIRVK
jgi:putative RNA 2'-phosphotransferase